MSSGIHVSTCRDQSRVSSKLVQLLYRPRKIGATARADFHFNASRGCSSSETLKRERARRRKVKDTQPVVRSSLPTFQRGERRRVVPSFVSLSLSLSQFFPPSKISVISREEKTRGVSIREIGRTIFNALRGRRCARKRCLSKAVMEIDGCCPPWKGRFSRIVN